MKAPRSAFLSWLHQHYRGALFLTVLLTAGLFRFYRLTTLPPGLSPSEASAGLKALSGLATAPDKLGDYLFTLLQLGAIKLFGQTALALRIIPAVAGVLAVILCYQWARAWFGRRVAILTAFLLAVTPWAVTMSRTGVSTSLVPLWQMLALWLITMALHRQNALWSLLAGLSLGLGVFIDGTWWFAVVAIVVAAAPAVVARKRLGLGVRPLLTGLAAMLLPALSLAISALVKPGALKGLAEQAPTPARLLDGVARVAAMFNLHGDDSYVFNLSGMPMLNFFVGVMFIIGLLILIGQLRRTKYLALFLLLVVGALPAAIAGRPDAARAIGALIPALTIAAIGINYMLERWYQTFPINAAARSAGLTAMVFVLAMTGYQGYNQYFIAWAQTRSTYDAHSEGAVAMAKFLRESVYEGKQYVLVEPERRSVVDYLSRRNNYSIITLEQIDGLPGEEVAQFIIARSQEDDALKKLRSKHPKARLTPYLSDVTNDELFSVFEVRK